MSDKGMVVLVPTRSRPQNVGQIVDAWDETGAWEHADLCFIADADDAALPRYIEAFEERLDQIQRIISGEWRPLVPKLNRVAVQAAADYGVVAFMGDDHLPRTPGWAQRLIETCPSPGLLPRIVYGADGIQDMKLPTWWAMSNAVIRSLGRMVPADVQHLYCDNAVKTLGEQAGIMTYLPGVLIEHRHPIAQKAEWDAQYVRVNRPQQYDADRLAYEQWIRSGKMTEQVQQVLTFP